MQTQVVALTRTETVWVELPYRIDPDTKANIEDWANRPQGMSSALEGHIPNGPQITSRGIGPWHVVKSKPLATVPLVVKARR